MKKTRIVESRIMNVGKLITHRLSLNDIHRGIEVVRNSIAIKAVIMP